MCGCEASHAHSMLVMINNSHCRWNLPLRTSPSGPLWVLGGIKFGVDGKELQVLFGLQCGILKPWQSLYIKGGGFVDARGDSNVIGGITMWGERRGRDHYMRRRSRTMSVEDVGMVVKLRR